MHSKGLARWPHFINWVSGCWHGDKGRRSVIGDPVAWYTFRRRIRDDPGGLSFEKCDCVSCRHGRFPLIHAQELASQVLSLIAVWSKSGRQNAMSASYASSRVEKPMP